MLPRNDSYGAASASLSQPLAVAREGSAESSQLLAHIRVLVDRKPEDALSTSPKAAVMVRFWPEGARDKLRNRAELLAEAAVPFFGEPRQLLVVQLPEAAEAQEPELGHSLSRRWAPRSAVGQLAQLEGILDDALQGARAEQGPWMWPLHDAKECLALLNMASFENDRSERELPRLQRLLRALGVAVPWGGLPLLLELRDRYGEGQAYSFAWSQAYVQMLWALAAVAGTFFLAGGRHPADENAPRQTWELFKFVLLLWGLMVVVSTWRRERLLAPHDARWRAEASAVTNPNYRVRTAAETRRAAAWLALGAAPVLLLCVLTVAGLLLCAIQFQAWLIWDWGDCIHLGCRDPQMKHGFLGWLLEVGSDVLLAAVFEGMLSLSGVLGEWVAGLENYKLLHDHKVAVAMHTVMLEAIGKVLPYVFLALIFVPQWHPPVDDPEADCSDLWAYRMVGRSAFQCLRRRVPLARRRTVFKQFMKGPFVVAPFIAIVMKAIVPLVVQGLDLAAERAVATVRGCGLAGGLARLLGLIFAHDCGSVGCLRYVFQGRPFGASVLEPSVGAEASLQARAGLLQDALRQGVRKPFEPIDELLELKLSFLWVLLFAPVMPVGVLPTLGARLLETRSDLTKMLLARRRGFPEEAQWLHTTQSTFALCTFCFAVVWSFVLSFITYNNGIWRGI